MDHISVCICTYRRPGLLARLLAELQHQSTNGVFHVSVVIVDNDRLRSAEAIVRRLTGELSLNMEYYVEPEQNIALARNKAVLSAKGNLIAFIDDDEVPARNWLRDLHRTMQEYRADGVLGPVIPSYDGTPPEWLLRGGFYDRPTHRTGFMIGGDEGRTGNLLIRKDILIPGGEFFDPRFGSGAEDRDLFRRLIGRGHVFNWCNEAQVFEYVPPVRWKRKFLIKRALLRGRTSLARPTSAPGLIARSLLAIPVYTMGLPVLFVLGHHLFMRYLVKDCDHIGRVLALLRLNVIKEKYVTG
jgi:succinoglycan biosynthesis protein ExoM